MGQALNNHGNIGFAVGKWTRSVVLSQVVVGPQLSKSLSILLWHLYGCYNVLYIQEYLGLVCIVQV